MDYYKILKQKFQKLFQKIVGFSNQYSDVYYLSLGENCLTDNILERFKIKSFSTPYSHARSNIEYAIILEREKYRNMLNPDYLFYEYVGETKVVRNRFYSSNSIIFNELHSNGFEFTHHDVKESSTHNKSYYRKISRMLSFDRSKKLKFLYHYRSNENLNTVEIAKKAEEFLKLYQDRGIQCKLYFFFQDIVNEEIERSIVKTHNSKNVKGYCLNTLELWAGDDDEILWARKDDDLIAIMIGDFKKEEF